MDSLLDSDQPRLFRLGSIAEPAKGVTTSQTQEQRHHQILEAKARGKHRQKRVSNDLTSMYLIVRDINLTIFML